MSPRLPNLLHLAFFLALTLFAFLISEAAILTLTHGHPAAAAEQRLGLIGQIAAYVITLALAYFAFPVFWGRPFLNGLKWNAPAAKLSFAGLGLVLGFMAQGVTVLLPHQKELPIEASFHNPATIWLLAAFGVVLGPVFEEVLFRGFLLPALAVAVDFVRIPRDPDPTVSLENLVAWRSRSDFSGLALIVSSVLTSLVFALLHAQQLGWTWSAVALLASVSGILCYVRIRTNSVAASSLVHGCYNLSLFLTLFVSTGGFRHLDRI